MHSIPATFVRVVTVVSVAAAFAIVVAPDPAWAAVIPVTTTEDSVAADGQTSLREAFAIASTNSVDDTISLGAGLTYLLDECLAGALAHTEAHVLVVQGNASVIEQSCDATAIIDSSAHAGSLHLQNLTIDGGPNAAATGIEGAAIRSESQLALTGVEIRNVLSPGGSVVWSSFDHGITPYRVTITNSDLHHNTGTVLTCDNCSMHVSSTTINDNTGSGISLVDGYPLLIENSTISNNTRVGVSTTGQGFPANKMTVNGSTITGNGRAGIRCLVCSGLSMALSTVTGNGLTAVDAAGGIAYSVAHKAGVAGALVSISQSTISNNTSAGPGGGLSVSSAFVEDGGSVATTALDRVDVVNNQSVGGGGGVAVALGQVSTYRGTISNNTTTGNGGGLSYTDATGPYDFTLDETEVRGNNATGDGGGVHAQAATAFVHKGSALSDNTAGGNGGGLKLGMAYSAVFTDHDISGNTAVNGAGVDVATEALKLDRVSVTANSATATGGGVRVAATSSQFINSTFSGNEAATGGGVAVTTAALTEFDHVTMADDEATTGAHIAAVPAANVHTTRSAIVSPITGSSCAGIGGAFTGTSGGYSFRRDATCGSVGSDTVSAADPQLGPLTLNSGTLSRLPAATSPLGGLVPVASCPVAVDQRTFARPAGTNCDAGALEIVESAPMPSPDQAIADLAALVAAESLKPSLAASLVKRLDKARAAIADGDTLVAKDLLQSFSNAVLAQSGKKIPVAAARLWSSTALDISASL